jgi:hypothetical protein
MTGKGSGILPVKVIEASAALINLDLRRHPGLFADIPDD